jgi:carboxypeptidase D
MLYIDQPTQVGHSYSIPIPGYTDENGDIIKLDNNSCPPNITTCGTYSDPYISLTANSTPNAAPNFWKTLQGFMGAFPQYSRDEFYFTTESYGGHYGPTFNEYIEEQNAALPDRALKISLNGVLIGNGWYDPLIQYQAYYNFSVSPGNTYDFQLYNETIQELMFNNTYGPGNCVDQINACYATGDNTICETADNFCANNVESIFDNYAGRDEYDMRELYPDPFPPEFYVTYLNTPAVQSAIGAFVNFTEYSNTVGAAFGLTGDDARKLSIIEDMRALLDCGVSVTMYTGDADYNCNWLGGEAVSKEINPPGFCDAGYTDIVTADGVTHGQVRQAADFAFVRIYESGHEVPFYQPLVALEMLTRVIGGRDIATGKVLVDDWYRTRGPLVSAYREGNATVQLTVVPVNATYNTTTNAPNPWR